VFEGRISLYSTGWSYIVILLPQLPEHWITGVLHHLTQLNEVFEHKPDLMDAHVDITR
jgi:hypothetical protein